MNRRGLLAAALAAPALTAFRRPVAGGTLVELPQMPSAHVAPRDVTVWLPPGYEAGADRHPVLYMHDGQNLFDPARAPFGEWGVDEHLARLIETGQVRTPIVVGVHNTPLRLREYVPATMIAALPAEVRADLIGLYGGEPLSDGYLAFLVEELKPLVDRTWRTLPGRDDTAIMGSSMGGLISLYAMMQRPETFGAAGCVSTHWPLRIERLDEGRLEAWREVVVQTWSRVVREGLPDPATHRLYMDRGDETLDQFYPFFQSRIDQVIRDAGWGPDRFRSLVFPGAAHNEPSWNQRLDVPLTFLLPPVP
ncbi:alpha/beta hydrolase [Brevundimonas sp.]|jgi:enterochelin esterase-like enzyme|uniref:alpha/beta hydrolase n=1 Tax=Brevundimonas sp. TaxID=1871086 RepID=UPI002E13C5B9|nr:alpha/beta hydrolase-fold protein [Brevundimonas sp.]